MAYSHRNRLPTNQPTSQPSQPATQPANPANPATQPPRPPSSPSPPSPQATGGGECFLRAKWQKIGGFPREYATPSQVSFFTGFADCFEMRVIYVTFVTFWVKKCILLQTSSCLKGPPCSRGLKACKNTAFLSRPGSKCRKIRVPPPTLCSKCRKIRVPPLLAYGKCRKIRVPPLLACGK